MLDDARRQKLMDLFAEGVELDPEQRRAFAERVCGDDRELLRELLEMLSVPREQVDGFLATPAVAAPDGGPSSPPEIPGYANLVPIAEGGMGMVYRADQLRPVRRTVAIKAIRPGMDTRQVLARFDAEREALARVAHPYIAVVHDAGVDEQGRPYLAMEFVEGSTITHYCRARDLELVPLLELFLKVCEAVDHAHRRGVLHRDLKPGNVLVVDTEEGPIPKVIDFGIAKALDGSLGDLTLHTVQGAMLGTPEYMSPEQFAGDAGRVDTRTDVYALGVLLYELLSGARPFDSDRLRESGIAGMARIVRHEVPPRPSARLRARQVDESGPRTTIQWGRQLHTDLDWVVMKALEKEPDQRYHTPRALAEDVRRFLRHEPIEAGPPSGFYRMRKFARRYRIQLGVAAGLIAVLTAGLFGTLWFLFESKDNEARALANAREATGTRLAATAALVARDNPNLALLLAIEADERSGDFSVRETILDALPRQNLVGRFAHADYGSIRAEFVDDRRLLTRGVDPVFWLTDLDSGRLERRFVGHSDRLEDMALSPDGQRIATASRDGTARIWSLATGECRAVLEHPGSVRQVFWGADGGSIYTLAVDGVVRVFASEAGARPEILRDDQEHMALAPGALRFASVNRAGGTELWGVDGRLVAAWPQESDPATGRDAVGLPSRGTVAFSPDGSAIARWERRRGGASRTLLYAVDGALVGSAEGAVPVQFLGDRLVLNMPEGVASMSLGSGVLGEPLAIPGLLLLFAIEARGRWAIGFDRREDVCVVDLVAQRITQRLSGEADKNRKNRHVVFHPDGERFVVTGRELLIGRVEAEYQPFDLPVDGRSAKVASLAVAGEALALVQHVVESGSRWSLWSIDRRQKLADLPIENCDELHLVADGSGLQGLRLLDVEDGDPLRAEVMTFDLEGGVRSRIALPYSLSPMPLRPEGGLYMFAQDSGERRLVRIVDSRTGAERSRVTCERGAVHWMRGPRGRYLATPLGSRSVTEVFDLRTQARVARVRGPVGAGHYGVAVDEERGRLIVVLGDLRARSYALDDVEAGPTGEYTRLVRSNDYHAGVLPDGSLAWVVCSNEVHLFDAVTCAPFAAVDLRYAVAHVAARADSSELIAVTHDGRCQRLPLHPGAVARRVALGELSRRERELYRIGTAAERTVLEEQRLCANPTSRNLALLGESRLDQGDLDGAIDAYRRCCETGPLAPMDLRRYLRLLELLARRHGLGGRSTADRSGDLALASVTLREALRCGVTRAALDALPGFVDLVRGTRLEELLPR